MKLLKYILIVVLTIILIYSSISCVNNSIDKQKSIVLESICKTYPKELLSESSRIITERLKNMNIANFTIDEDIYQSQLVLNFKNSLDIQVISDIITAQGKWSFQETIKREDVLKALHNKLNAECVQKLDSLLGVKNGKNYSDAIIGEAAVVDTFAIGKFFRSKAVRLMLPTNIKFCWSMDVSDSNRLQLYAVSVLDNGINETSLEDAHTIKNAKYAAVSMTFKQKYRVAWENLTKNSIDKAIAFVIDGRVYSAPIVSSAIKGGNIELTGNFSEEEANSLVAIISCGELPLDFDIK